MEHTSRSFAPFTHARLRRSWDPQLTVLRMTRARVGSGIPTHDAVRLRHEWDTGLSAYDFSRSKAAAPSVFPTFKRRE
jgi:hypothetical protein